MIPWYHISNLKQKIAPAASRWRSTSCPPHSSRRSHQSSLAPRRFSRSQISEAATKTPPSFQHVAKCWNQKHHESWCFLVHVIHKSKYLAMPWSFCLTSPRSSNRMRFTKAAIAAVEFNAWITSKPSCCDGAVGAAYNKNSQTQKRC